MRPRALCAGLLLAAAAALPASADPAAPSVAVASQPFAGGLDWLLKRGADAFTSDSKLFGEVHLPVIAANPNSGITYGVLPVWFVRNSRQEIVQLIAPMVTYNRTFGAAFSGSYYFYPSSDEKLRVILEKSERTNYRASFRYEDRMLLDGLGTLLINSNYEADGSVQFYGVGPGTTEGEEASERLLERWVQAELGARAGGDYFVTAGWKVRRTEVQPGPFQTPSSLDPSLRTSTTYSLPSLRLSRDTRDFQFTPSDGSLTEVFAEYSGASLGSTSDYEHYGAEWRDYIPASADLVTALHAKTEWSGGGEVPFTALSALGGPHSLRGYPEGRFQDRGSAFANVEERWRVHSIVMIHAQTEFQVAPFLEAGTVFPTPGQARSRGVAGVAGLALRAVIKPAIVGKVEIGVGREGPAAFVGIDYPF